MPHTIRLPLGNGEWLDVQPSCRPPHPTLNGPARCRVAYAAAHVVVDPLASGDPLADSRLDWEATLTFRHHLWSMGLAVAEAMDTAQRGSGLPWPMAQELIRRSVAEARATPGAIIACGAGTDHLAAEEAKSLDDIAAAYEEQVSFVEGQGARVILMASRALAARARAAEEYAAVYDRVLSQVERPVILHWLGEMFDPDLAGYWGTSDLDQAMEVCLDLIGRHQTRIDGIKLSLLDERREIEMRRRLPAGVRMYTGDDFNYPRLIHGDGAHASDALLGVFDAIAPAASAALRALDDGDSAGYHAILDPTVPFARYLFQAPTHLYKTGVVFVAYLNGHQRHFRMVNGQESARSVIHLAHLFLLADQAGILTDPGLASARMKLVLQVAGAA